jgi:hypothetical protein
VIEVSGGTVTTRLGAAQAPDLVLTGTPHLILALITGKLTTAQAVERGLGISGDDGVLGRVLPVGRGVAAG